MCVISVLYIIFVLLHVCKSFTAFPHVYAYTYVIHTVFFPVVCIENLHRRRSVLNFEIRNYYKQTERTSTV